MEQKENILNPCTVIKINPWDLVLVVEETPIAIPILWFQDLEPFWFVC